jgi:hypothetical protein
MPFFIVNGFSIRKFPGFLYIQEDLTEQNPLAVESNYFVSRSTSSECQLLWFGETNPEVINLKRLRKISDHNLDFQEINAMVHPLP